MYYNKFKKFLTYLNYVFIIYLWILIIYSFFRYTNLIKSSPLGKILLKPIKFIIESF